MAKIIYTDCYLPKDSMTAEEYFETDDIPVPSAYSSKQEFAQAFRKQVNLECLYVEKQYNSIEIFTMMLEKLFASQKIDPLQIKYVFYTRARQSYYAYQGDKDYYAENIDDVCVNVPYYLTERFQLHNACVMSHEGECASVTRGIDLARACCDVQDGYALVLTPALLGERSRYVNIALNGDSAGLMLIGSNHYQGDYEIVDTLLKSDGRFSYDLYQQHQNLSHCHDEFYTAIEELAKSDIQNDAMGLIARLSKFNRTFNNQFLAAHQVRIDEIKAVMTLNIKFYIDLCSKSYPGRVYQDNMAKGGHSEDVDLIRNFNDFSRQNKLAKGDYVAMLTYGTDYTGVEYGGVLLRHL